MDSGSDVAHPPWPGPRPGPSRRRSGRRRRLLAGLVRQVPALVVLVAVAAGLGVVAVGHWRIGSGVLALALLLAAALRLSLAPRHAGWLVVRSRVFDTALLLLLGLGTLALAASVPRG